MRKCVKMRRHCWGIFRSLWLHRRCLKLTKKKRRCLSGEHFWVRWKKPILRLMEKSLQNDTGCYVPKRSRKRKRSTSGTNCTPWSGFCAGRAGRRIIRLPAGIRGIRFCLRRITSTRRLRQIRLRHIRKRSIRLAYRL